ncbi:MAG: hypothetical protein IAF00_07445 [Phycisphaerales bacterium]|nr:hypothetical protein [Phycisphaerales bacterium]
MTPFETLVYLREVLKLLPDVASCKIGLEANIVPESYPLIRLVPSLLLPQEVGALRRRTRLLVYFGVNLLESSDGLEAVYEGLLNQEQAIRDAMMRTAVKAACSQGKRIKVEYVDTITDEDRLPLYKLMASRFEVES